MSTWIYFGVLLVGFALQYACDSRSIAETAQHLHLSVSSVRWSSLVRFFQGPERCYHVRIRDQHGRVDTRMCRVKGVVGLPIEVAFEPVNPRTRRR